MRMPMCHARGPLGLMLLLCSFAYADDDACDRRTGGQEFVPPEVPTCVTTLKPALENGPNQETFDTAAACVVTHPELRATLIEEIAASNPCAAETLMLFEGELAASDDSSKAARRVYTHYIINTPGPLGDDSSFDSFERARVYARRLFQVEPDQQTLEKWRRDPTPCIESPPACDLRAIGKNMNEERYGRADVIPSTLFPFHDNARGYDSHNALWLADMSELAYHLWSCPVRDPGVVDQLPIDPKKWTCVDDQLAAWGYQGKKIAGENTQGFIAARDDYVIIAFRGTDGLADIIVDMNARPKQFAGGGKVHAGFADALEAVWPQLAQEVKSLPQNRRIFVTGHSLGGALAQLAAYRMERELRRPVRAVYTYGSPRVGNGKFARLYGRRLSDRTFLYINGNDPVARVPTWPFFRQNTAFVGRFDEDDHRFDAKAVPEKESAAESGDQSSIFESARRAITRATSYLGPEPDNPPRLEYAPVESFDTLFVNHHRASQYLFKFACLNTEHRYAANASRIRASRAP